MMLDAGLDIEILGYWILVIVFKKHTYEITFFTPCHFCDYSY